jgi:hypothetical protein
MRFLGKGSGRRLEGGGRSFERGMFGLHKASVR